MSKKIISKLIKLKLLILISILFSSPSYAAKRTYACVFDPVGRTGDIFTVAQDMANDFLSLGVDLKLYPYHSESIAIRDFKMGLCDAMVITGMRANEFNKFTFTLEALGGVRNYDDLLLILNTINQPKAASLMQQGPYEVAGIFPAGAIYTFLSDRKISSIAEIKDRRMIVLHGDLITNYMSKELGVKPVFGDTTNFANKFKRGEVDIVFSPAAIYEPFELEKGIDKGGGVITTPTAQLTLQVIIKRDQYPAEIAQKARQIVAQNWYGRAMQIIEDSESKIKPDYWIKLPAAQQKEFDTILRNARIKMRNDGIYDPRMLKLLLKVRCKSNPKADECINPVE